MGKCCHDGGPCHACSSTAQMRAALELYPMPWERPALWKGDTSAPFCAAVSAFEKARAAALATDAGKPLLDRLERYERALTEAARSLDSIASGRAHQATDGLNERYFSILAYARSRADVARAALEGRDG